jgi:hypothetical protein
LKGLVSRSYRSNRVVVHARPVSFRRPRSGALPPGQILGH